VESGLDRPGSDLVDPIANLELGLAEDLAVGLGGEQFGDALDLVLDEGHQAMFDPVGLVALLRCEREGDPRHGMAFHEELVKRFGRRIDVLRCTKFSTYNRDAHPRRKPDLVSRGIASSRQLAWGT
jgi:hypothetical protein